MKQRVSDEMSGLAIHMLFVMVDAPAGVASAPVVAVVVVILALHSIPSRLLVS